MKLYFTGLAFFIGSFEYYFVEPKQDNKVAIDEYIKTREDVFKYVKTVAKHCFVGLFVDIFLNKFDKLNCELKLVNELHRPIRKLEHINSSTYFKYD